MTVISVYIDKSRGIVFHFLLNFLASLLHNSVVNPEFNLPFSSTVNIDNKMQNTNFTSHHPGSVLSVSWVVNFREGIDCSRGGFHFTK